MWSMNRKYGHIFAAATRQSQHQPMFFYGQRFRLEVSEEVRGDATERYGLNAYRSRKAHSA